MQTTS